MKITPNPPIPHSYPFYVCPLDSEAGLFVVIRPGYNPWEAWPVPFICTSRDAGTILQDFILKSVKCEIQTGINKIKGKGIHELKQSLHVLCMLENLH